MPDYSDKVKALGIEIHSKSFITLPNTIRFARGMLQNPLDAYAWRPLIPPDLYSTAVINNDGQCWVVGVRHLYKIPCMVERVLSQGAQGYRIEDIVSDSSFSANDVQFILDWFKGVTHYDV